MIGTAEIAFIGEPSRTRLLIATYTSVFRFASNIRTTFVFLNISEVLSLNTLFFGANEGGKRQQHRSHRAARSE